MVAQVTGLAPGDFVHTLGDAHLYLNHLEQVETQLEREPYPLPTMALNPEITSTTMISSSSTINVIPSSRRP